MSRIFEVKESTFVKVSIGMMVAFAGFWMQAGRVVESVETLKTTVRDMQLSVQACLNQCASSTPHGSISRSAQDTYLTSR